MFTRHLALWLAVLGAGLVGIVAMTVGDLREEAAERRESQIAFLELAQDTRRLDRIVLESQARGRADAETFAEVERNGHAIDAQLERDIVARDGSQLGVKRLLDSLTGYRAVAERVLVGLGHGNRDAGGAAAALGPAFDEVAARLSSVESERARQATAAESRARRLSTLAVGSLLGLLLLLVVVYQRGQRRAQVAATEAAAVAASEARFRGLIDDNSDLVLLVGAGQVVRSASRAARDLLGVDPREIEHRPLADLLHPDDVPLLASVSGDRHRRLEIRMRHRNGYWLDVEARANDMSSDPHVDALVITVRDVSERKAFEEQLRHRAFHDPLTQLPNRALLSDRLQHALSREGRFEDQVAVLFVDLDDFKTVNDTLGHAGGDELLVLVARRLRSCLRSADTAARLGGDEFAVLLEGVPDVDHVVAVAQRILDAFNEPYQVGGLPIPLRTSVGVAIGVAQTISADELLRNADIAMYAAKRAGKRRYVVFRADAHGELIRRFPSEPGLDPERVTWFERSEEQRNEVLRLLRAEGGITPAFQPIVDLGSGAVAGYEALARFPHDPDGRPPNAWFAQAHRCGLGVQLEAQAVEAALAARDGAPGGYLSVNLSPAALRADELLHRLPGDLRGVVVEITEHELVADGERLHATLEQLRARGARVAVDDAGAGYAGLRQLMILRPDLIKLDRGLIEDVAGDEAKQALVECFVRFAERTDAHVCAEGIESLDDLLVLARIGVTYGQGYAIARPGFDWPEPAPEAYAALQATTR
ncbi:MAG TPA: EAL domain-containing protein [Solirubrobacteraceae bacterium]|nr:EAL domain-containing protein [Solirubrobacteraceae bacterium]